jgi:hypothetical protein
MVRGVLVDYLLVGKVLENHTIDVSQAKCRIDSIRSA